MTRSTDSQPVPTPSPRALDSGRDTPPLCATPVLPPRQRLTDSDSPKHLSERNLLFAGGVFGGKGERGSDVRQARHLLRPWSLHRTASSSAPALRPSCARTNATLPPCAASGAILPGHSRSAPWPGKPPGPPVRCKKVSKPPPVIHCATELIRCRRTCAERWLEGTDLKSQAVAIECGPGDAKSRTRFFHQKHQRTPHAYRQAFPSKSL